MTTTFLPRRTRWLEVGAVLALFLVIQVLANETDLATSADCYYNYNHYSEGDRILTNEPCLNCTCHNKMLMCYLKVCPFTKPIGQDCTIEKREDQCCPIITCPEVPVELDHSSAQSSTDLATHQKYGCSIEGEFYPEGAQIPGNPKKPCELCYCIRNMTSCVMQECTLHVDGCRPIYNKGVCCPVRYDCAHDDEMPLMLEDQTTTTEAPSPGFIITTTSAPAISTECYHNGERFIDGESIDTEHPCEHCYCMRGDIVCAVQECKPVEMHGKNCTAKLPGPGECCPQIYECESDMQASTTLFDDTMAATTLGYRGDDSVLTTPSQAAEHLEKDIITTEPSAAAEVTSQRIDDAENEIHDKDYDHLTGAAKPARTNLTAPQIPTATESEDSTTILSKLDDMAATTILSESGPISDEQITTVLPIGGRPQEIATEKAATESESMLDSLYTTIKSIVDLATTTLSPIREPEPKPHGEEDDSFLSNVIPGEGDCLENGVSYSNNTSVPPRNVCDESCLCHNSLVRCEQVKCAPMPPNAENCKILHEEGLCCPSYHCESMEFSTGPPPTHPAESQVIHRDGESTTVMQPLEEEGEQQQTTVQSPKAPISSKFDDSSEMTPEPITEGQFEKHTAAPELESSTAAKETSDEGVGSIENKFGDVTTQSAEGTTQAQSHTVERIHPESERPEIEQQTTQTPETGLKEQVELTTPKEESPEAPVESSSPETVPIAPETTERIADELPQDKATTQSPERVESEVSTTAAAALDEKLPEEPQPATTQQPSEEEIATTQKVQQADEISTEGPQQPAAPSVDEQKPSESVTTESPSSQKTPVEVEIQTEQQPTAQPEDEGQAAVPTTAAPSGLQDEISTEQQPEAPKPEESATTQAPSIDILNREGEISTEEAHTEEQKPQEIGTTAQPSIPQKDEISTEKTFEQKPDEFVTTEATQEKQQPATEIVTESQPEGQKQDELATTQQPISDEKVQQPEEISTEMPLESPKPVEIATTQGPSIEKEQTEATVEEVTKQEEHAVTTEISQPSTAQPTEKETIEQTTVAKLAEEPIEAITTRITDEVPPKAPLDDSEIPSTEKTHKEEEYTEKATENLIPDSSTDGYVKPELPMEEISTEKHIEPEQMTTEKVAPSEQETTEQGLPQTTVSSSSSSTSQPQIPVESDEYTTKVPQLIPQEPTATEKEPTAAEKEPTVTEKEPTVTEKESIATEKEPTATEKEPTVTEKEPTVTEKEPTVTEKEPTATEKEPTATEKEPAFDEISSEHAPIDEHQTEKDLYIPATESFQQQDVEPSATQTPEEKEKQPEEEEEGQKVNEQAPVTSAPTTAAPEVSSTERVAQDESTTLSSSKLNLGEVNKDGEVSGSEKPDLDEIENVTTEKAQQPELPSSTEFDEKQQPHQQITTEQPSQTEKISTQAPLETESITTAKQSEPEATTMYEFPSKQEDMEIITEKVIPSQQEDVEMVTMPKEVQEEQELTTTFSAEPEQVTESKAQFEPSSTQAPIESESEATTLGKVSEEQPTSQEPLIPSEDQSTASAPLATEKQPVSSEQTTFGAITEKSTEPAEIQELVPTTQPPPRPELESDNQMHIADEKQPEESVSTTEASKQEEPAEIPTTAAPSIALSENVNRIGEESTTTKAEESHPVVTEALAVSSESPKEQEQPHVEFATTEPAIVDITTLMTKIRDEIITEKQEQPEQQTEKQQPTEQPEQQTEKQQLTEKAEQQTEKPQPTEQPEQQTEKQQPTEQPEQQTEKQQSTEQPQSSDEIVTTEKAAVPLDREATTLAQQAAELDVTTEAAKHDEIPSEQPTVQPEVEQMTQGIELASSSAAPESVQTTQAPIPDEQQTTQTPETGLKEQVELTTPKEESPEAPVESSSPETVPIAPETTAFDQESSITTTSAPIKLADPSISPEEQQPAEAITTERIAQPQQEEQESASTTAQPSLFDGTTIKSVVELLTTLHPREPEKPAQESEATTAAAQPQQQEQQEVYTTESSPSQENKTSEEATTPQTYAAPPESSNKIPLIREPSHDETTITKLAESFDTTTLPSILLTSSHTDRISDSTTIKNTQNEIMEMIPSQTTTQSPQQAFTEEIVPDSPEAQQPTYQQPPGFDSGYGNVPSNYPDEEYGDEEEPTVFGPGTCRYGGKLYVSAQQIPRDDPCDFCFCFRSDIICLQQSCPPPINGCHEEPIQGFCCPRYECPVSMALVLNSTTTTTTTLPPYLSHFQRNSGKLTRSGCQVQGQTYKIGERVTTASGPCMDCICGGDGQMKCDPKVCSPEPMLRQMIASAKRR